MDPSSPSPCHKLPVGQTGDVDRDGQIVDLAAGLAAAISASSGLAADLLTRLRAQVGPDVADDVDPEAQVSLVFDLLTRAVGS